jgi:hypothetical protein
MKGGMSRVVGALEHLDRFEEVVFALIMVLTFTCSLSVTSPRSDVHDMIVGALGCNLAWGIIDAAFYLVTSLVERGRTSQLVRDVQGAAGAEAGRRIVADALPDVIAQALEPADLEKFRSVIASVPAPPDRIRLGRIDLLGAVAVFFYVVVATLPVIVPFLLLTDVHLALRISNGVALVLLFGTSYKLAARTGLRPFPTGAAMVGIGAAMVAVAIALGG